MQFNASHKFYITKGRDCVLNIYPKDLKIYLKTASNDEYLVPNNLLNENPIARVGRLQVVSCVSKENAVGLYWLVGLLFRNL